MWIRAKDTTMYAYHRHNKSPIVPAREQFHQSLKQQCAAQLEHTGALLDQAPADLDVTASPADRARNGWRREPLALGDNLQSTQSMT